MSHLVVVGGGGDHFACFLLLLTGLERQRVHAEPMQPGATKIYLRKFLEGICFIPKCQGFFLFFFVDIISKCSLG